MKAKAKQRSSTRWYDQRRWALFLGLASLLVAYAIGIHSLDTGSWQQYILTLLFLIFGANRTLHSILPGKKEK